MNKLANSIILLLVSHRKKYQNNVHNWFTFSYIKSVAQLDINQVLIKKSDTLAQSRFQQLLSTR